MNILEVINQPEGRKIEFKENLPSKTDLCKTVVAFANDAGGEIFIGIKNKPRKIVGVAEEELVKIEEQISNIIHDNCYPTILPDILFINYKGKHIIVVKIYKGSSPPYFIKQKGKEKGTYIRVGSTTRLADSDIINELERLKQGVSFDSLPVHSKKISELDFSLFKNQFKEITGETLSITVLEKLNLIVNEQKNQLPTNALVLLSNDKIREKLFPYAKIECARFKGSVPGNFIDQKTIDVPLSFQAEEAYKFVLRHISQSSTYESVYRRDRWEYPAIAIREAIRNAVIHRDYSLRGKDIKIAIFDDKIEITSPGKLMPTIDFNEMEAGQSDIRNIILAPVFKKLGIIEQWGNGLLLISKELKKYPEIKMEWSEPGIAFRITFKKINVERHKTENPADVSKDKNGRLKEKASYYGRKRTITDENGRLRTKTDDYEEKRPITAENDRKNIIAADYDRLGKEEKKILNYLLIKETITRKQAIEILNVQKTKAHEVLRSLVDKNLIVRKGKGRSTYYTLTNKR